MNIHFDRCATVSNNNFDVSLCANGNFMGNTWDEASTHRTQNSWANVDVGLGANAFKLLSAQPPPVEAMDVKTVPEIQLTTRCFPFPRWKRFEKYLCFVLLICQITLCRLAFFFVVVGRV
jgi:hypothetical protein